MKDYSLYYWDRRLEEAEVKELLQLAWDELYDLEFDQVFGAWRGVHLAGADPLGKERFNVSLGLMYDPKRKLVWAMDLLSRPYALKLDLNTADISPRENQ